MVIKRRNKLVKKGESKVRPSIGSGLGVGVVDKIWKKYLNLMAGRTLAKSWRMRVRRLVYSTSPAMLGTRIHEKVDLGISILRQTLIIQTPLALLQH